jgi:hypothetical protein
MSKNKEFEFFSGKSIPRNYPCPCNSGKKYKKCCFNNKLFEKPPVSVIQAQSVKGLKEDVLYRVSYKKLPKKYVEMIDKWLENNKIYETGCWHNSHILSISNDIDGIEVVNGYYGYKLEEAIKTIAQNVENVDELEKRLIRQSKYIPQPDKNNGFLRIPDDDRWRDRYFDINNKVLWGRHSWNKIIGGGDKKKGIGKDLHFDLTTELWDKAKNVWTHLNEVQTFVSGSIKDSDLLKQKYDEVINNTIIEYDQVGMKNMNSQFQQDRGFPNPFPDDDD